ncbi:MAG: putative DNA binding domain-containing protein [Clostridiales bacterium]|nr:putative DNA binding domain-containing protein [Clostridiales bacterium]
MQSIPYETEKIEFKEVFTNDVYKDVIAFANTEGGTIFIGVNDSGDVVSTGNIDDAYTRITNGVRDAITPDVTLFVKYALEDNGTIRIEIGEGSYKPYYLKAKGLKPSGVYIRQGASSAPASYEQIRQMIKDADGDFFEDLRSLEQDLTFNYCSQAFAERGVDFGEEKYNALGIRSHTQGMYTNMALLFSDQCAHTIKVAVFADEQNTEFKARKEFQGAIFKQLEDAFAYLQLCNQNPSSIDGLTRTDYWDYPDEAVREALVNAIIHRDYSFSGSIIINVNKSGMEFISIGGLLPGLSPLDIRNGISQLRNRKLADVFHRLNFIESYGTGIRRIFALYDGCSEPPDIVVTPNSFKLRLPNMNAYGAENTNRQNQQKQSPDFKPTPQMQALLDHLSNGRGEISEGEIQELLGIKRTRTFLLTKQMAEAGLIQIIGRGSGKKYKLHQ